MTSDRLSTDLWVKAHLRQWSGEGKAAYLTHQGESASGFVILKIIQIDRKCRVISQASSFDENLSWFSAFDGQSVTEDEADSYIQRYIQRDSDLWALEIEEGKGHIALEGKILK